MISSYRQSSRPAIAGWVIFAGFVFSLAVNLPGHLSYDSVVELAEGRASAYAGWHPPVTSWILGLFDSWVPGASLFVVLNTLLIYGALWILLKLGQPPNWAAAALALFYAVTPQFMIYPGIVWKDVLFAGSCVCGCACLSLAAARWRETGTRFALLIASFLLLILASLARQNGIVMLLAALPALGWVASRFSQTRWRSAALYAATTALLCAAVITSANVALGKRLTLSSGPARQFALLQAYDILAVLSAHRDMPLREIDREDPALSGTMRGEGERNYTPERNDPLVASVSLQKALLAAPPTLISRQWTDVVTHDSWAYLEQRADLFRWVFFTPNIDACLPLYTGVQGPPQVMDDLDMEPRWDARDSWLRNFGLKLAHTPIEQHGVYAFIAIVVAGFLLVRRRTADLPIICLQIGALVFTLTFFFISLACDYRYLYALDLSAMIGLFYISVTWRSIAQAYEDMDEANRIW